MTQRGRSDTRLHFIDLEMSLFLKIKKGILEMLAEDGEVYKQQVRDRLSNTMLMNGNTISQCSELSEVNHCSCCVRSNGTDQHLKKISVNVT